MQPPTNNTHRFRSWTLSTLFFLALAGGAFGIAITKQRALQDYLKLRNYQAPATIAALADQDTMTDKARHIFYVNHPDIRNRQTFGNACPSGTREQTIVLGCYKSDQAGIFLLDVTDPRLDGVKQVTAAHEMLHAAYDRFSTNERNDINKQLLDYYHNGLTDERIKSTIDAYKKTEPNDVVNEMHSVFGTEVAHLPKGLEEHYAQYFTKRSAITDFSARYQEEFTSLKMQVTTDDAEIKLMRVHIDSLQTDLKTKQATISSQQQTLVGLRSSNPSAYNAGVPNYNALVNAYNDEVQQTKTAIDQYNQLVNQRNAIAVQEDNLVKSLNAENQTINN